MDSEQVLVKCPQCGFSKNVPAQKLAGGKTRITCPKCGCKFYQDKSGQFRQLSSQIEREDPEEDIHERARRAYEREQHRLDDENLPSGGVGQGVPWADAPYERGWFAAFSKTVLDVMFQAPQFALRLKKNATIIRALAFYLIICVFYIAVEYFWTDAIVSFLESSPVEDPKLKELLGLIAADSNLFVTILLRSAVYVLQLYLVSFLMYVMYALLTGYKVNFALVFQILAYGAAPLILAVIPGIGAIVGMIWSIGSVAVCCKAVTGLDWPKTLAGFLPPLLLLFLVIGQALKFVAQ